MMKFLPEYKLYICGKPYSKHYYELQRIKEEWGTENVIFTGEISMPKRTGCMPTVKPFSSLAF